MNMMMRRSPAATKQLQGRTASLRSAARHPCVSRRVARRGQVTRAEISKVLVAGATGGCGRQVVQELVNRGVSVVALVRDPSKATDLAAKEGVEVVTGNVFQMMTLPKATAGCDAVIIATGANDYKDPTGPFNVDYQGTLNLLAAAQQEKVKQLVLISSIGADDLFNPLNLFWGVLFWKKRAEEAIQRSGINYTVVRPGGLKNELRSGEKEGRIVMKGPDTFGVPPVRQSGSILRRQVAEVAVGALYEPAAAKKVVEIIAEPDAEEKALADLFASVS